jgi:hypothetical protein
MDQNDCSGIAEYLGDRTVIRGRIADRILFAIRPSGELISGFFVRFSRLFVISFSVRKSWPTCDGGNVL